MFWKGFGVRIRGLGVRIFAGRIGYGDKAAIFGGGAECYGFAASVRGERGKAIDRLRALSGAAV